MRRFLLFGGVISQVTPAVTLSASIQATSPGSLTESNLNTATVTVDLVNATYDGSLATSDFTLLGAPSGTTINSVSRTSGTRAVLTLAFNGTDFDVDATLSVRVETGGLASGGPLTTDSVTITAVSEVAASIQSTSPSPLTEANLSTATVVVDITGGTYASSPGASDFILATKPTGTTINSVAKNSSTRCTLTLAFNGTDFDSDLTLSVTVSQTALATGTGPATTSTVAVTAIVESASIQSTSPSPLTETNLNTATVTVDLVGLVYDNPITAADFSLPAKPSGTTIASVSRTSNTRAVLTLAFDGTDFDTNATLSVTVGTGALVSGGPFTTGTVSVTAVVEGGGLTELARYQPGTQPSTAIATFTLSADPFPASSPPGFSEYHKFQIVAGRGDGTGNNATLALVCTNAATDNPNFGLLSHEANDADWGFLWVIQDAIFFQATDFSPSLPSVAALSNGTNIEINAQWNPNGNVTAEVCLDGTTITSHALNYGSAFTSLAPNRSGFINQAPNGSGPVNSTPHFIDLYCSGLHNMVAMRAQV